MSDKSNNNGRGYEYACLKKLEERISKFRPVLIQYDSSYETSKSAFYSLDSSLQNILLISADAAASTIISLEPLIVEDGDDSLTLSIQSDDRGKEGDVRDILAIRRNIQWEIGFSVKHNHEAVKHSRLSRTIDFGDKWYGVKCSDEYKSEVAPIFDRLDKDKANGLKWNQMSDKIEAVYKPLLKAFMDEVKRAYDKDSSMAGRLAEYLVGKYDFYKVISVDSARHTLLQGYNLHGTLNKASSTKKPEISVPIINLPTEIVQIRFSSQKPDNTVELYMDNGWQFSFRIHNAEEDVVPSLKFDVQLIGRPTVIEIVANWI